MYFWVNQLYSVWAVHLTLEGTTDLRMCSISNTSKKCWTYSRCIM